MIVNYVKYFVVEMKTYLMLLIISWAASETVYQKTASQWEFV